MTTKAESEAIFELKAPYATKFTNPVFQGLGNGSGDFDRDGAEDDSSRGIMGTTPTDAEYLGTDNFTNAGPQIVFRGALAHLNSTIGVAPETISSHGITKQGFRLEGSRKTDDMSADMGYIGYFLVLKESFTPATTFSIDDGISMQAKAAANRGPLTWRFMLKNGEHYYVSSTTTAGDSLDIASAASETWIRYRHAEGNRHFRFNAEESETISGAELTDVSAIGIYAEIMHKDGTAMGEKERISLDITEFIIKGGSADSGSDDSYAIVYR